VRQQTEDILGVLLVDAFLHRQKRGRQSLSSDKKKRGPLEDRAIVSMRYPLPNQKLKVLLRYQAFSGAIR